MADQKFKDENDKKLKRISHSALFFFRNAEKLETIDWVYINLRFIDGKLKQFRFFNVKISKRQGSSTS